jgi:hypothetical protein
MGGEFVVNKESTAKYADLLVAINNGGLRDSRFAGGGWTGNNGQALVGDPVSLALRMAGGGQLCFAKAFGEALGSGSDIYGAIGSGIGATATYIGSAMGGALSGKVLGNAFKAEGGPIEDWWRWFIPPGIPYIGPGGPTIGIGPGITFGMNPQEAWDATLKWIDDMWEEFLESQQAGWRNFAETILTPGDVSFDALNGLSHELTHFGEHLKNVTYHVLKPPGVKFIGEGDMAGGFIGGYPALHGIDYVPRDNFPIRGHEGEAVLTKSEAEDWRGGSTRRGVTVNFNLTGTVIDRKAVNEFAEMIYPRLKRLEAWGH